MKLKKKNPKNLIKNILILIVFTISSLFAAELILKITYPNHFTHHKYGWSMPKAHDIRQIDNHTIRTFEYGFKRYGNISTTKTKVLLIGDSFTLTKDVKNGKEYYASLEKEFPTWEMFVAAQSGYGTLQEYMILQDHISTINPDFVIWQFTKNDFRNNNFELSRDSYPFISSRQRPFLIDNEIEYRIPSPLEKLRKSSILVDTSMRLFETTATNLFEGNLYKYRKEYQPKNDKTEQIFQMIRNETQVPIYLFSIETEYCNNYTLCITNVDTFLKSLNIEFRSKDGHWNEQGHKIAGEYLVTFFNNNPIGSEKTV